MTVKIGINGFGRIGRCILSHIHESRRTDLKVVAINATGPLETSAHLMRYDSVHGRFSGEITTKNGNLNMGDGPIQMFSSYEPTDLDWKNVDVVLECTGNFNDGDNARVHLNQGAKKVLISAPAKNVDRTIVLGANENMLLPTDKVISNGSCTTNCLAPLVKVLNNSIGIERGIMTAIHSYTGDQPTLDRRHSDLYRARAAALSLIPTSTGAAKALEEVLPEMAGKLDGTAIRVPTPNVSCIDLTFEASKQVTMEEVNACVAVAASGNLKGIIGYDPAPKVSIDFNHTTESSIFAPDQTKVIGGTTVRVLAWYDNEWGFSVRMADLAAKMGTLF